MDLCQRIVRHHVWLIGEIVDRRERRSTSDLELPITLSVEYIDDDPTLRSAVSRLIGQLAMWNAVVAGRADDFGVERDETVESMRTGSPSGTRSS